MQLRADLSSSRDKDRKTVRENDVDAVNLALNFQYQTIGAFSNGDRWTSLRDANYLDSFWLDFSGCRSDQQISAFLEVVFAINLSPCKDLPPQGQWQVCVVGDSDGHH
jgi:hypothetical protein